MEQTEKGNKKIYKFRLEQSDNGSIEIGSTSFCNPDSDGVALGDAMREIKKDEIVTVTVAVDRPRPVKTNTELLRDELKKELPRYEIGADEVDGIDVYANTFYTTDLNKLRKLQEKHNAMLWCDVTGDKVRFRFHSIRGEI